MIRVSLSQAELAAKSRPAGYLDELLAAGEVDGEFVVMSDEAYDRLLLRFSGLVRPCGPGCQLGRSLSWFARRDDPCGCAEYAALMDAWGPEVCRRRLDADIMPHLKAQAAKRNLGFAAPLVRPLVLRAIWLAEQEQGAAGS